MRNTTRILHLVLVAACIAALVGTSRGIAYPSYAAPSASIIRVTTTGATSGACGGTWGTACSLQHALKDIAVSGDEIWVGAGTHKPTTGSDRSATFQLKSGVGVYGGFAMTETLRSQRNWTTNATILSGDLGSGVHSYHVVMGISAGSGVLDGFTVTGGNANGADPDDKGGGMYNPSASNTVLTNVVFDHNSAGQGGGMYNYYSSPNLTNVIFSHNSASQGGGMVNSHSNPTLTNVTFSGNAVANGDGGGMVNTDSSAPTLTNVTFDGNSITGGNGGGMLNDNCSPRLLNVTFANNSTTGGDGGALYNDLVSTPVLTNVTFYSNTASMTSGFDGGYGGAVYGYANTTPPQMTNVTFRDNRAVGYDAGHPAYGGALYVFSGAAAITNTILWGNTPDQIYNDGSTTTVSYSIVQGGYTGTHVITADPLLGAFGDYGGNIRTIPLLPGSSAIDAIPSGTNGCGTTITSDERGLARPRFMGCDMGAFESSGFQLVNTSGDNQSTRVNTAFALPLQVSVIAMDAGGPVNGGKILFDAPSSGASASLTPNPAIIANGTVSATATANGIRGAYDVAPWTPAWSSISFFHLRNTAVFYVKPGASGNCSSWATACDLQTALGSVGSGDEIWAAAGTYTPTTGSDPNSTFTLTSGVGVYGGFGGITETARSQRNWTVNVTTLNGNLSGGAHTYHVVTANSTDPTTTLDGLTITGAQGPGQVGGGVYINDGSLTIANCHIVNNSEEYGGGVFQSGSGRVAILNSLVERNHSGNQGGGLYINGDAALTDTLVLTNTSGADGGGLTVWAGRTDLTGGMFAANSAGNNGGGVNANNSVYISGTQFISNTAAQYGGGLLQWNAGYTVALTNVRFERNRSTSQGGGLYVGGNAALTNTLVLSNTAGWHGGGLYVNSGRADLIGGLFSNNVASTGSGGAVGVNNSISITGTQFVSNTAVNGGGLQQWNTGYTVTVTSARFERNTATGMGGGASISGTLVVSSSTFVTNTVDSGSAQSTFGGGLYAGGASQISASTFAGNSALCIHGGSCNNADGGGLYSQGSNSTLTNVAFSSNVAGRSGGGMGSSSNNLKLANVTFTGDQAGWGGGMYHAGGSLTLTNVLFGGNLAGWGGGILNDHDSVTLTHVTFGGNWATNLGGGIYNYDNTPTLVNCILWGNSAPTGPQIENDYVSALALTYSDVQGTSVYTGAGNINADPQFLAPITATAAPTTSGNYRLSPTSPAIDAGTAVSVTIDLDGVTRPWGKGYDMGAYEYHQFGIFLPIVIKP